MKIILLFLLLASLSGCAFVRYSHTTADGQTRSFFAISLGSTTAVKDAQWKVGDSDLHIGDAQQQQPLAEIVGTAVGAAVKAAK